jgi:hypothetical protein
MLDKLKAPYIGVTGIMSAAQAEEVLVLYTDAWKAVRCVPTHLLMLGVLASHKTMRGEVNRWPLRYPKREDIAGCFVEHPLALNLLHFAPGFALTDRPVEQVEAIGRALGVAGPHCHGLQINGTWPLPGALRRSTPFLWRLVLQTKTLAVTTTARPEATDLLLDMSGGKGQPADVGDAVQKIQHSPWSRGIGVAGGFCADFLPPPWVFGERGPRAAPNHGPGLSIDAEGRLRDDADGGGNLDMAKVGAYLRAAVVLAAGAA